MRYTLYPHTETFLAPKACTRKPTYDCIFFTVFLVNRQLTGLTSLPKHLLNNLFVFWFRTVSRTLFLKLATQPRDHSDKKQRKQKAKGKRKFCGPRQFELKKKVLLCMNLLLNLKKVV